MNPAFFSQSLERPARVSSRPPGDYMLGSIQRLCVLTCSGVLDSLENWFIPVQVSMLMLTFGVSVEDPRLSLHRKSDPAEVTYAL